MGVAEKNINSRVWLIQYRAAPGRIPQYQDWARAGTVEQGLGDITPVKVPSKYTYGQFEEIAVIRGAEDRPTTSLVFKYPETRSAIAKLAKQKCALDVQIHFGRCKSPTSFNLGWEKILVFENAVFTNYATTELGAFEQGDDAVVEETVDLSGEWFYEIVPIRLTERATGEVGQEIISVVVGDTEQCGDCGTASDGCQRIFAVSAPGATSPGVKAEVLYSIDGGTSFGDTWIDTLAIGEDPSDAVVAGDILVVVSHGTDSIHYADLDDITNDAETWAEVSTGIVAAGSPVAITAAGASDVWMVGDGGYIYYSDDPTSGFEVQDAGSATASNLLDVNAYDADNVLAVGASNAVVYTVDGGASWGAITGPDTVNTPNLSACLMLTDKIWLIGTVDNALWATRDSGTNWEQARFPGDTTAGGGTGTVHDIVAATRNVLYMAHETSATAGRILRSLNGGQSWYVLPEGSGDIPENDKINKLATCYHEANVVFAGGLAGDGADGIIIKGS